MEQTIRAVLLGANINNNEDFTNSMEELAQLAEACEIQVAGKMTQNLSRIQSAAYFGKGKIEEVAAYCKELEVDLVIFNDELTPSQIRNLESELEIQVIDRTVLILDIFARRAKTKEAQLQVEVARLKYMLPRLTGSGEALGRQGGGAGLRNRGAGETKLELDRRKIEDRISSLEKELEALVLRRQNQRKKRKKNQVPVAALVGYTNAGKSTIMNSMLNRYERSEEKLVFEKDMLFATLETSVRKITLPDQKSFLLTDTVGFISKLPHHLVKAFRSTLEEVLEADLLIHVVDYSNPGYQKHIAVTEETLQELGTGDIPILYAFNKIDRIEGFNRERMQLSLESGGREGVFLSAKDMEGIDRLTQAVSKFIFTDYVCVTLLLPYDKGNMISYFNDTAAVKQISYENHGILITLELNRADYEKYQQYELLP